MHPQINTATKIQIRPLKYIKISSVVYPYLSQGLRIKHSCLIRSSSSMTFLEAFLPRGLAPLKLEAINDYRGLLHLKMTRKHHMYWGKLKATTKARDDLGLGNHRVHAPRDLNFGGSWCIDIV